MIFKWYRLTNASLVCWILVQNAHLQRMVSSWVWPGAKLRTCLRVFSMVEAIFVLSLSVVEADLAPWLAWCFDRLACAWLIWTWCFACLSSRCSCSRISQFAIDVTKCISLGCFLGGINKQCSPTSNGKKVISGPAASVVMPSANSQSCLIAISSTTTMNPCDPATRQIAGIQETRNEDTDAVLNLAGRGPISRSCLP